jgi:hypothetical protein
MLRHHRVSARSIRSTGSAAREDVSRIYSVLVRDLVVAQSSDLVSPAISEQAACATKMSKRSGTVALGVLEYKALLVEKV